MIKTLKEILKLFGYFIAIAVLCIVIFTAILFISEPAQIHYSVEIPQAGNATCFTINNEKIVGMTIFNEATEIYQLPYTLNGTAVEGTEIQLKITYYIVNTVQSEMINGTNISIPQPSPVYTVDSIHTYIFTVTNSTINLK